MKLCKEAISQAREYCAAYPQEPYTNWLGLALDRIAELEAEVERLRAIKFESERIMVAANLKGDQFTYDLMRTVLGKDVK